MLRVGLVLFCLVLTLTALPPALLPDERTLGAVREPDRMWRHRATILLAGPACSESIKDYERALASDGTKAAAWRCLALKRIAVGSRDAYVPVRRWSELQSEDADAWLVRGIVTSDIHAVREALWLRPGDADAWNALGVLCTDGGGAQGLAEEAFRTAVRLRPDFAEAWTNLASVSRTYLESGGREALFAAREAVRLAPDMTNAWTQLGRATLAWPRSLGAIAPEQWHLAVGAFEHAVRLAPSDDSRWGELAAALKGAQDRGLARLVRDRLSLVDPARARALE